MTKDGWISAGILGTILWGCLSWQGFVNKKRGIFWNVIGPEGGWSSKEIEFFNKNNINLVKLSDTILRTSTASINASSILNQWRIDLKLRN